MPNKPRKNKNRPRSHGNHRPGSGGRLDYGANVRTNRDEYYDGTRDVQGLGAGDTFYIAKMYKSARETQEAFAQLVREVDWVQMYHFSGNKENDNMRVNAIPRLVAGQTSQDSDAGCAIYRMPGCNQGNINTKEWTPTVKRACELASDSIGHTLNHCVCTLYRDEEDSLAYHHDKLLDLEPDSHIVSVSFGAARPIVFCENKGKHRQTILLQPGSLLAIGPKTNTRYMHGIPKLNYATGARISLSARTIATFARPEQAPQGNVSASNSVASDESGSDMTVDQASGDSAGVNEPSRRAPGGERLGVRIEGQGKDYQTVNYPFVQNFDDSSKYSESIRDTMERAAAEAREWLDRLKAELDGVECPMACCSLVNPPLNRGWAGGKRVAVTNSMEI